MFVRILKAEDRQVWIKACSQNSTGQCTVQCTLYTVHSTLWLVLWSCSPEIRPWVGKIVVGETPCSVPTPLGAYFLNYKHLPPFPPLKLGQSTTELQGGLILGELDNCQLFSTLIPKFNFLLLLFNFLTKNQSKLIFYTF